MQYPIPGVLTRDNSLVKKVCDTFLEEWPSTVNEPPSTWKKPLLNDFIKKEFLLKGKIEGVNQDKEIHASMRVVLGEVYLMTNKYNFEKMTDNNFVTRIMNGSRDVACEIEFDEDKIIDVNDGNVRKGLRIKSFTFGTMYYDFTSFQEAFSYEIKNFKK